ncbi:hypothetical protein [Streptomyces fuscigenes]|uniref:hypothetical protein n=1 Tax=Streptomyces fuscigenes TaxID=1528880 RepID=UPI001F490292|nr:hypothetical protein [Streptomyces fuscigenes]MCF3964954.1 hypothetical protein [Streptomyces fuscigenes]
MDERTTDPEHDGAADGPAPRAEGSPKTAGTVRYAACVQCAEPTEYPETTRGATLCPVCEWQEGQRLACSG